MTIIYTAPLCNLCCNTECISMYVHQDASWLNFNQLFIVLMLDRACVVYQLCYSSMQRVLGCAQCLINVHQSDDYVPVVIRFVLCMEFLPMFCSQPDRVFACSFHTVVAMVK